METISTIELIWSDFRALSGSGKRSIVRLAGYILFKREFQLPFWYRLAHQGGSFSRLMFRHYNRKAGCCISPKAKIGKGLVIPHPTGIVINGGAVIGEHCFILQQVTVGSVRGKGVPVIGNHCVLGAGCKILGRVGMGSYVFVGANAVVVSDIPDNATVAGIPGRVVNENGRENVKYYS